MKISVFGSNLLLILWLVPFYVAAEQIPVPAKIHPWGTFDPGAWKIVRITSESLDEAGRVCSITTTDTRTTLLDIDNNGVSLEIEARMDVAGKRFEAEPQLINQSFFGELQEADVKLEETKDTEVTVEGRKIPCKQHRIKAISKAGQTTTTLYFSETVPPYVLKRESITTDPEGKDVLTETVVETLGFNMPVKVRGEIRSGIYTKTVQKNGSGVVTTFAVTVPEIPGGVVYHSSKEVDKSGRLVRRNVLELLDYNSSSDKDDGGIFGRKRSNRRQKTPPR